MLQQVVKTFFVGQVAFEHAAEASKKSLDAARERAQEYKEKVAEYKTVQISSKLEKQFKEKVAELRKSHESFEKACEGLSQLLVETGELKNNMITIESQN